MNNLDKQYCNLLSDILEKGSVKSDRTGTGTKSIFGTTIRHNMNEGFPILTTKRVHWKAVAHELLWFIKGGTNIKYLVDNDVNIWNGDAYKNYKTQFQKKFEEGYDLIDKETFVEFIKSYPEFAEVWGELGPVYGKQWRNVTSKDGRVDQLQNIIDTLKTNPDDRRMIVNAWNVAEIGECVLPPCHYAFQFYSGIFTHEERYALWFKNNYETGMEFNPLEIPDYDNPYFVPTPTRSLSLMFQMRSIDTLLGAPFNLASYGLLLSMIAKVVGMAPHELIFNGGDTHLYSNHYDAARLQMSRTPFDLPQLKFAKEKYDSIDDFTFDDIILENYQSHNPIKAQLSN